MTLQVDHGLEAMRRADTILIPGWCGRGARPEPGGHRRAASGPPARHAHGVVLHRRVRAGRGRRARRAPGRPRTGTPSDDLARRYPRGRPAPRRALRAGRRRVDLGRLGGRRSTARWRSSATTSAPRWPTSWPATSSSPPTAKVARPSSWPRRSPVDRGERPAGRVVGLGGRAPRPAAHRGRPGRARPPQPAPVQPALPRGDRDHPPPVAPGPADPPGPAAARDDRRARSSGSPRTPGSARPPPCACTSSAACAPARRPTVGCSPRSPPDPAPTRSS